MQNRSNPVRTGAAIGALAWFLLANGVAFVNDTLLGRAQGQTGWGQPGCYAGVLLAPVGAGLGALVAALVARPRAQSGRPADSEDGPDEPA